MVISTGMTFPRMASVWALYALQKSMMFTPCGPRAVPTGGAGGAAPACSCTLTSAAIFFFGGIALSLFSRCHDGAPAPATGCHLGDSLTQVSRWTNPALHKLRSGFALLNLFGPL